MVIKLRTQLLGEHQHVDVFVGNVEGQLGNAGRLVLRQKEFELLHAAIIDGAEKLFLDAIFKNVDSQEPTSPPLTLVWERDGTSSRWPFTYTPETAEEAF